MEKLKEMLGKPAMFWVASGSIVAIGLTCWIVGSVSVAEQAVDGAKKVDTNLKTLHGIPPVGKDHPSGEWLTKTDLDIDDQKKAVLAKWREFYQEQEDNVFVWPAGELSEDFIKAVENPTMNALARPLSDGKDKQDKPDELSSQLRDQYRNSVHQWFPKLAQRVVYGLKSGETAAEGALPLVAWGGKAVVDDKDSPLVLEINRNHFEKLVSAGTPSTRQVLIAQEDYWVFKALCEIIIDTNSRSTGPHDTIVRDIMSMKIAGGAVEANPRGMGARRFDLLDMPVKEDKKDGGGRNVRGKAKQLTADETLMDKRYVNEKGQGIPYNTKPDKEPFREYRLLPVQMSLVVDKSKLQHLLSAFADSLLPVEVQQLRLSPGKGGRQEDQAAAGDRYQLVVIQAVAYLIKNVDHGHLKVKPPEPVVADAADADAGKVAGE